MAIHVVVGASRGIGYQFLKHFSADPSNKVIGIVRTPANVEEQIRKDNLQNVTILSADLTDYSSLLAAAEAAKRITGGVVDYLWNNAGYVSPVTDNTFFTDYSPEDYNTLTDDLRLSFETNVTGVINSTNAFLPLVQKSTIKKVITLSTGLADDSLTRDYGIWEGAVYSASKAATNTVIAKYDARYRSEGILFLSISPGVVNTGHPQREDSQMGAKFYAYQPQVRVLEPSESVEYMVKVADAATAKSDGGQFYSHLGKGEKWL